MPTNFAPVTPRAVELEQKAWDRYKAESDLKAAIRLTKSFI